MIACFPLILSSKRSFSKFPFALEQPMRALPDRATPLTNLSPTLLRASSFESIHLANEDERAQQAKLRARGCNDSFRQAVDKSYTQETPTIDEKVAKQKFRFANFFGTK